MELNNNKKIAVLLTCHNRIELTKRCLDSVVSNKPSGYDVDIYLVDDGCTDGTGDMVHSDFPEVKVIQGDGSLFWNGGMNRAFSEARKQDYDFYLWVNDDVAFYDQFMQKILTTYNDLANKSSQIIVVGVMVDSVYGKQTYGGIRILPSIVPLKMGQVSMANTPQKCDTFHGNCVLIHKSVVEEIGVNDSFYQHAFGDSDYGLMATKAGCEVWMTNYPVGVCDRHDKANKWLDPNLSFKERRKDYHKKTANPPRDWKYFCKKFCGWNWWIRYWAPDVKLFIKSVLGR